MKKRNRQPRSREALNSELIRRPIRRCWPLFLLPTALAFCIGFLYPFLLGLYRSFCEFTCRSIITGQAFPTTSAPLRTRASGVPSASRPPTPSYPFLSLIYAPLRWPTH